jgi:hypothetical protein
MKVSFRQSGGFAGLVRGVDLDTSKMDTDDAAELEKLVAASDIQGHTSRRKQAARDLVQYEISIDHAARLTFDDHTIPTDVQPLLKYLRARSAPMPLDSAKF